MYEDYDLYVWGNAGKNVDLNASSNPLRNGDLSVSLTLVSREFYHGVHGGAMDRDLLGGVRVDPVGHLGVEARVSWCVSSSEHL